LQLLVWLCDQLQADHLSGAKCIFSGAFAPELQTYFQLLYVSQELLPNRDVNTRSGFIRSGFIPIWQKLPDWVVWLPVGYISIER
jgi:hypothetical protein